MAPPKLELTQRPWEPGDEEAILRAFNEVFGALDPGFRPRTLEAWRWQFLGNPNGHRVWIGLDQEGRVVAQQASLGMGMQVGDERMCWSQVVDSFADPRFGRGLRKPGLYATVARGHSDHFGGEPPQRDPIMYGLPVRPAWRIGKLYLDYEVARSQDVLCARADGAFGAAPGVEVEELERYPEDVEALFERARAPHGAIAVRDAAYLNWRFADHPERPYALALARRRRTPVGLAVHRRGTLIGCEGGVVCDWLVEPGDDAAAAALLAWIAERTRADGRELVLGLWPDTCPDWRDLQRRGFRVRPSEYYNVICQYTARFDMRWLYWNWYYTLGDFDLC